MKILKYLPIAALAFSCTCCTNEKKDTETTKNEILDLSVNPGTDFYKYACGGWIRNNPLSPEYSRFGTFNILAEKNEKEILELIEGLSKKENKNGTLKQKIADLYNLALDTTTRNEDGAQPIRTDLTKISITQSKTELITLACQLTRKGIPSFFNIYADGDIQDSKNNIVTISQGGFTLDSRDYYLDNDKTTKKIREEFKDYITQLFILIGEEKDIAEKNMRNVMKVETALAKAAYNKTKLRDVPNNYHAMTYIQLKENYKDLDWDLIFKTLKFPNFNKVSVSQPEPIHEVEKIIKNEDLDVLKSYINFHLMDASANYLDDNFANASFNFYSKKLSGVKKQKPEWKKAVNTINSVLGMAVGKMYVEKYFPAEAKIRMTKLVKNLQNSLAERINAQQWMCKETKEKALDKLKNFYIKIGYPDKWKDYTALTIDKDLPYWKNIERAQEFEFDYQVKTKVNKPVNKKEWLMTPQTINAYYNPSTNEICFPAGILQPPFFDINADDATNYGAIGVVIGHEMTHGFDDQGRQFDKDGNLNNWWTDEDSKKFNQRIGVMRDFFSKIEIFPSLYANGALTLGENIADHGGLEISYNAFKKATKENPLPKKDGFTPEQRFFQSYAFVWAQNITEKEIRKRTKSDPHSLGEWRVNGALPQIDAWYKAFNITEKDSLFVPKDQRVDIW